MKKILFLIIVISSLISCNFIEESNEKQTVEYPFKGLKIEKINIDLQNKYVMEDSITLSNLESFLDTIKSTSLIRGKRLHGAENIGNAVLSTQGNEITIIIKKHPEQGMTASLLEENDEKNLKNSLGRLYHADDLLKILKKSN